MGTTCTHKEPGVPMEKFFVEHGVLSWRDDLPHTYRVLASAYKMPVFYAAIEKVNKETGERVVWAAVIKVSNYPSDYYNLCYKDMSEDMGPCYYDCPAKVMDLLTPTDNAYANEWRNKCRENLKWRAERRSRKIAPDAVLEYGGKRYKVLEKLQKGYLRVMDDFGSIFRMRPGQVRESSIVT